MRAYQFISEAPVADFEVFGSPDYMATNNTRGMWHPGDAKLYKSEKAIKKIHDIFAKTSYNFNLYIVTQESKKPLIGMDKKKFEELFKKIDTEGNITVIYSNNIQSNNGTPLTGWALAHRIGHALQSQGNKIWGTYEVNIVQQFLDATGITLGLDHDNIPRAKPGVGVDINYQSLGSFGKISSEDFKKAATSLLTTRAGRMNLLNNLEMELYCELIAQYLVTGEVKLGSDSPEIQKYQDNINRLIGQLLDSLVGEVISF